MKSATETQRTVTSPEETIERLSTAIEALRGVMGESRIDDLQSHFTRPVNAPQVATAFAAIASIKNIPVQAAADGNTGTTAALLEYQRLLKDFKAELPHIRGWLLAERARLVSRRSHSTAVESWLRATRQTRW
ncbi:MAG TPA: hypothetical protein VJO35_00325 [Terriglobales bacterium]|nr:hypothetical protein [Terriglobales bacterium]